MEAAQRIRHAVDRVSQLRRESLTAPGLRAAVTQVKRFQAQRFAGTYADLLQGATYQNAARFFLEELYSDKDYAERDAQFSRIAGAVQKFFPSQVVATAVALAELHALTEALDHTMAQAWLAEGDQLAAGARYIGAWRATGRRQDRQMQLDVVLSIGHELARLTRTPGLRLMLKMMRAPAAAAGLDALQRFLEAGFDTFAALARHTGRVEAFLDLIRGRESALIASLFDAELVACETELTQTLGQAR